MVGAGAVGQWRGRHQEGNETRTCGGGRPSTAGEGGAISKRRRGRVDKNAAGAWLGAGQKRARKGFGWMREGGGAGAQQPRAGGRGDSLGGATDSVLQPPYSQSYKNIPKMQLFLFLL